MRILVLGVLAVATFAAGSAGAVADAGPTAVLSARPDAAEPGLPWRAEFTLRRGGSPVARAARVSWIRTGSKTRSFRAREVGAGRYRAAVVFPVAGRYRYGVTVAQVTLQPRNRDRPAARAPAARARLRAGRRALRRRERGDDRGPRGSGDACSDGRGARARPAALRRLRPG